MPVDSLLVSIAVCIIFLGFAGVLAWADHVTNSARHGQPSDKPDAAAADPVRKRVA